LQNLQNRDSLQIKNTTKNRVSTAKRGSFAKEIKKKRDSIANWFNALVVAALLLCW